MSSWSPANGPPRYGDGVSSDAVLVLIGDVAALLAAGAALVALVYARETVGEAKAARQDADRAARDAAADRHRAAEDAAADRREAEYARTIRWVERVGEIVEDLFWSAGVGALTGGHGPNRWMADRNRLGVALVGLSERLPKCAAILNAATERLALDGATEGRQEVLLELDRLSVELTALRAG
jgi:hypothetical protein